MSTVSSSKATRATFLTELPGERAKIYVTATGLKLGVRGKVEPPLAVLSDLNKGAARRVRKALRRVGRTDLVLASLSA